MMVKPIGISFSKGPFSGSMFVLGGVSFSMHFFSPFALQSLCFWNVNVTNVTSRLLPNHHESTEVENLKNPEVEVGSSSHYRVG